MNIAEASSRLGLSENSILELVKRGMLVVRAGHISTRDLQQLVRSNSGLLVIGQLRKQDAEARVAAEQQATALGARRAQLQTQLEQAKQAADYEQVAEILETLLELQ